MEYRDSLSEEGGVEENTYSLILSKELAHEEVEHRPPLEILAEGMLR